MTRIICQNCRWYTPSVKSIGWGRCAIAATHEYLHKTKWRPEGYRCKHTSARRWNHKGCKTRFEPKEE